MKARNDPGITPFGNKNTPVPEKIEKQFDDHVTLIKGSMVFEAIKTKSDTTIFD